MRRRRQRPRWRRQRPRSAAAAALYLRKDEGTGQVDPDRSMWDFLFMQFVWPIVDFPSLDLGFESPHAGQRVFGGAILMFG